MNVFGLAAAAVLSAASAQASTVFFQDFSGGLGAHEQVSGNFSAHDGVVGHNGGYANYEYSYYQLALDLTGVSNAQLDFDYDIQIEGGGFDKFNLIGGVGALNPPNGVLIPTSGLSYNMSGGAFQYQLSGLSFSGQALGHAVYDLSAFDGQQVNLRFQFGSDYSVTYRGVDLDNVRVTGLVAGGAVPEPASWALMILGFGAIGATLRARRAVVAA